MRRLAILILGILIGALAVWWYLEKNPNKTPTQLREQAQNDARALGDDLRARLDSWGLNTENIKSELDRTGKIIRQKSSDFGKKISDSTSDARITTKIKGKILADKELSAWNISVSTTDGHVTLAGKVSSEAQIGKAVLLAMETDGVKEVVSTLQVKP